MDAKDIAAGLLAGQGELDLAVQATGAEKCAVENVNAVGRRNHLGELVCGCAFCECGNRACRASQELMCGMCVNECVRMRRMSQRSFSPGRGNSILRSKRPDGRSAVVGRRNHLNSACACVGR